MVSNIYYHYEKGSRQNMEDNIFPFPGLANQANRIFIVCDGVGGSNKGEEASWIVSESMGNYLISQAKVHFDTSIIESALSISIEKMKEFISVEPSAEKMAEYISA